MKSPWSNTKYAVALSLYLGAAEFIRSGFYVGFFPLYGLERLHLSLSYIGFITTLHYLTEAMAKTSIVLLLRNIKFGYSLIVSATIVIGCLVGFIYLPQAYYLAIGVIWGLAMAPLWPRIAAFLTHIAKEGYRGRSVTYAWLIIAPIIGLGGFGIGFLAKNDLTLAVLILQLVALFLLGLGILLTKLDFPEVGPKHKERVVFIKYLKIVSILVVPAFLQNLVPHLLTSTLFPYIKLRDFSTLELGMYILPGVLAFALLTQPASRYADQRNPAFLMIASIAFSALGFGLIALVPLRWILFPASLALGAAVALLIPGWNSIIVRVLPQNEKGEGWSVISTISGLAIAAGPFIGSLAWDLIGPSGPFILGFILLLFLLLYYLIVILPYINRLEKDNPIKST